MAERPSFEHDRIGSPPAGWMLTMTGAGTPVWTVETDDSAPTNVLKQSGNATFPVALKLGTEIRDGYAEVKFRALAGSKDRAGGIVWRALDANNYYVVRANALEDNVVLYKTVDGKRSPLDIVGRTGGYGVKVAVPSEQWHTLRVDFAGPRFTVTFNGKRMFEVDDMTFTGPGMVGLWTKADSVTVFDGFGYGGR
ncbi:MAG TPA: family 16 glycoside hydrolase [Alphaproteobacteria bacterium]|nr:family 16 glycoside hydrolase [Alphaproteobacteria bacterium]